MCRMHAQAVTGLVPADELGITLPHEHLLIDFGVRYSPAEDEPLLAPEQPALADRWRLLRSPAGFRVNLDGTDIEESIGEAECFRRAGGRTIVDLTPLGLGPDPAGLREISARTGLNVIASTGYYIDECLPAWTRDASVEELARHLVDEIERGGADGIRRGAIGEIAIESGSQLELDCVRAGARAQARTGAPCFLHVLSGILPAFRPLTDELIAIYVAEGGDLARLVLCHQDGSGDDVAYQERLLAQGIWLEYDTFGSEGVFALGDDYLQLPTDTQRIAELALLVERGHLDRLLISQDVCYRMARRSWGGHGLAHILESLAPRFVAGGISREQLATLMTANPARLLAFIAA